MSELRNRFNSESSSTEGWTVENAIDKVITELDVSEVTDNDSKGMSDSMYVSEESVSEEKVPVESNEEKDTETSDNSDEEESDEVETEQSSEDSEVEALEYNGHVYMLVNPRRVTECPSTITTVATMLIILWAIRGIIMTALLLQDYAGYRCELNRHQ